MVRHSPCEKYIEHFLVHPDGYSNDAIIELLRLKQLDFIGPSYLTRLRLNLQPPPIFRPYDVTHLASTQFLAAHNLINFFQPDLATKEAFKILDDPRAKEDIESMLVTDDPAGFIVLRMRSRGFTCTTASIERYKFCFFNTALVDSTDLKAILQMRDECVSAHEDEYEAQFRAVRKRAGYGDPRRLAAEHPIPSVARVQTQLRFGYLPEQLELSRVTHLAQFVASHRSLEAMQLGGPHGAQNARDYAAAAQMFGGMAKDLGNPDDELQKDLQQLALKTDAVRMPHILELSDGNHTVDVMPLTVEEAVDDE